MCDIRTFQEFVDGIVPVLQVVGLAGLVPHERAAQVRLWGHRAETQSRVRADDAVAQLILGLVVLQRLPEHGHETGKEAGQRRIEDQVEQQDFRCLRIGQINMPFNICVCVYVTDTP